MSNITTSLEDLLPNQKNRDETPAGKLDDKMKEIKLKEKEQETAKKAQLLNLPYINLAGFPIGPESISTVKKEVSKKLKVICFLNNGKEIRLGAVEYDDEIKKIEKELAEDLYVNVATYLISQHSFELAWGFYATLPETRKYISGVEIAEKDLNKFKGEIKSFADLNETIQKTSITELVTFIVAAAIKSRASDIHIEAEDKDVKIRFRIDGVLNDAASLDKAAWPKVISRIKQLAKLKINISDRPQDGRFSIFLKDDKIDVRVSALPTSFGESVVMRLLMSSATQLTFEDLGLRGNAYKILEREISRPNGMIVTTGPTGSGKTTTLYAILKKLNEPETKIITIEDPIEYELKGINQSQVDENYTFAKGLRSIVRQDPDIIMVGEIRDLETAEIAIQASLTGHLVLSTIHTNDAFGAVPRFLSLGAKPFLLAPALNLTIGQRLVRRICESCKTEAEIDEEKLARAKKLLAEMPANTEYKFDLENLKFYKGAGCETCQGLSYKGRIGIFEILPVTDEMKELITRGDVSEVEVKKMAKEAGVITMAQDGIVKALEGITSLDEVFRVAE